MFKISWILDFFLGPKFYFDTGGPKTPDKTTQIQELPEWARGYAKDTLAKASALTDINQNPYQEYGGQRIAGFDPMQQQSFQGAANMQPSQQVDLGSGIAGAAGLGALGTNYQAGQFQGGQFNNRSAQQYMNPYTQNVVDYQKSQALRDFQVAQPGRNAQAVQAGAFGGSRQAIVDAEAQRNLGSQLQGIEATGQQQAYQNAQTQFNADQARRLQAQGMGEASRQYGADLGMKGLSTGLQAASTLGQLGQTQYGQEMGINTLQNQYGAQQQQQAQRGLDTGYQDFLNQQNYPYKQLGFMSDMVRGLPLGQQSTASIYSQGPSAVQTVAGLGGAAYGFGNSGMFGGTPSSGGKSGKEGGLMESYSYGGVTSQNNKDSIVDGMYSVEDLKKAREAALNRRDLDTVAAIDERLQQLQAIQQAQTASIDRGLGSAFDQIPEDRQEAMMAGGGMVAFAPGGVAKNKGTDWDSLSRQSLSDLQAMGDNAPKEQTPEEYERAINVRKPIIDKLLGADVTDPYRREIAAEKADLPQQRAKDEGLAFAMASLKLLTRNKKPGENQTAQFFSGLGEAGESFISQANQIKKDYKDSTAKLRQSELLLDTAKQNREEGKVKLAMDQEDKAQAKAQEAYKTKYGLVKDVATLQENMAAHQMQRDTTLGAARITADAHRYAADKPGELERIMNTVNDIRSGKKTYAGKTGEDAATAYQNDLGKAGEARGGYRYTGPDKTIEQSTAIREKAMKDGRVETAKWDILKAGDDPVKLKAAQDNYSRVLGEVEQGIRDQADIARTQKREERAGNIPGGSGMPSRSGRSTTSVGMTPPPEAINILKSAPSPENRKHFDDVFGAGAAARVLGG